MPRVNVKCYICQNKCLWCSMQSLARLSEVYALHTRFHCKNCFSLLPEGKCFSCLFSLISVFQEPVLMMELVEIMRYKGPCWSLLISWMGLIQEETLRSSWQQTGRLIIIKIEWF